jgi:hypothetical protein
VIINETFARTCWPGESALDRRSGTELFLPYRQLARAPLDLRAGFVVLRTDADPMRHVCAARAESAALNAALPGPNVRAFEEVLAAARSLALAAVGIYGVISNSVARRAARVGLMVALGYE